MKRPLTVAIIAAFALTALAAAGAMLCRHFVTDQIMDGGDMTNPFLSQEDRSPLLPENGGFVSLSWVQAAMSDSDCYRFFLSGGPTSPVLVCSFVEADGNAYGRLELGGEDPGTGETRAPAPVPGTRWEKVERLLRETSLPAYRAPDPDLSDATTNRIDIVWGQEDGVMRSAAFDGTDAASLLDLLQEIAREAAAER